MNILIYSPSNLRATDQQAQAELLLSMGHQVFLLTWEREGVLHENFRVLGASAASSSHVKGRSIFFFMNQTSYLVNFCKRNKIDIVISHLQNNAVVAGLAKFFMGAGVIYVRHNSDYFSLNKSFKTTLLNKLANLLSHAIVAISDNVKRELIKEGVAEKKISRINLCYNFSDYQTGRLYNSAAIRKEYQAELLILYVARLDELKRHTMAFEVIRQLRRDGVDCKLVCIGEGPYRNELEHWIESNEMQQEIILLGFVTNVFDYLEAADILLLLSYSEASNHAAKEAAMCSKPVIVCKGVGDFGEYIVDHENSFLVNKENPIDETVVLLRHLNNNKNEMKAVGARLHETIEKSFGMEQVKSQYQKLLMDVKI